MFTHTLSAKTILVKPGQNIQAAVDRSDNNTTILIQAGIYKTDKSIIIKNKKISGFPAWEM